MRLRMGRNVGLRRRAVWDRTGALHAAKRGRSDWRTWGSGRDAVWCREGAWHVAALGRSLGWCRGATQSWAGGQRGIEQVRSVRLRSRAGCVGAWVQRETAQGRSSGARGAAWD